MMLSVVLAGVLSAAPAPWLHTPLPGPMPTASEHGLASIHGARLYWASFGAGPTVLLLHGGAGNSDHWAGQVPALAAHYRVVVVDARGHGRSTRDAAPLSYAAMADDVLALMDELKVARAAVVGWSDGGAVALDLALRHPERVTKLVAYGVNFNLSGLKSGGGGAAFKAYFARCREDYAALSPTPRGFGELQAALLPMWKTQPSWTSAQVALVKVPTLVLDGEHDEIIRQEHAREMARLIPGARLVLLPDTSHFALFQQPEAFNRAVLEFLGEARDGG